MGFKINNIEGEPFTLLELDEQVCKFWNIEQHHIRYAQPKEFSVGNWFDVIGWAIHALTNKHGYEPWSLVKEYIFQVQTRDIWNNSPEDATKEFSNLIVWLQPYFKLIDHWEELGYKPIQIS